MLTITSYSLHAKNYVFCVQMKFENLSGPYSLQRIKTWHLSISEVNTCFYIRVWERHMECSLWVLPGLPFCAS